jgi:hypothetical protein
MEGSPMERPNAILQAVNVEPEIDIAQAMRHAMTQHGKSAFAQLSDIWRLRFGPGKLSPKEYYYYRLYDDDSFSPEEKRRFLGKSRWDRVYRTCNQLDWWALAHDKLAYYAMLQGQNLPAPENRALFHRFRQSGDLPTLTSKDMLADYLRTNMIYPVFAKPVTGIRSAGVSSLKQYSPEDDTLALFDGRTVSVDDYVQEVEIYREDGYLFQEPLRPHENIAALSGGRLTTMRLIVGLEADGPSLMHALWKVPVGLNPADNFWRPGNLLGALDPETGRVSRLISGVGPDQQDVSCHPDTEARLLDVTLPDWTAAVAVCLKAATMFPGLRLQAWDVALTDHGPILLEVNIGGDFNLPQLALAQGIMSKTFEDFLSRSACDQAKAA